MQFKKDFIDLIGDTPLLRLNRASDETGCEILGKCEFSIPASRSRTAPRCSSSATPRKRANCAPAGDRRGHGGQYRHRPRPGRQRARLSLGDRHAGHPEPGKEGHAADVRRRSSPGPGGPPTRTPTTTSNIPAASPTRSMPTRPPARSGPTSSTMSPTGKPTSKAPGRRSGNRPVAESTALPVRWAPAGRWPGSPWRSRNAIERFRSGRPTRSARRSTACTSPTAR